MTCTSHPITEADLVPGTIIHDNSAENQSMNKHWILLGICSEHDMVFCVPMTHDINEHNLRCYPRDVFTKWTGRHVDT